LQLVDFLWSFVYAPKKVIVRGLGIIKPQKQLDNLIEWLGTIHKALPELELV
jgi:transcription-repair coupling factor (superfamily II helicase)